MRILAITHYWPQAPASFTAEELGEWARLGASVDVIAVREPPIAAAAVTAIPVVHLAYGLQAKAFMRGTCRILRQSESRRRAAKVGMSALIAWARAHLSTARTTARSTTPRSVAHTIITMVRAAKAVGLVQTDYDLIYADFPNDEASIAWIVAAATGTAFAFRDHSSVAPHLIRHKCNDAVAVLACSAENRRALKGEISKESGAEYAGMGTNIFISYLGVDLTFWSAVPAVVPGRIVCPGRIQEKKGQTILAEAISLLRLRGHDVSIVFAGDGPSRGQLEQLLDSLNLRMSASITGFISPVEMRDLLSSGQIVCLPCITTANGDHDGIPVALMEAMALERPCVSTEVGGIPELIENGSSGLLVAEPTPEIISDAIQRLLENPTLSRALAASGAATIRRLFNSQTAYLSSLKTLEDAVRCGRVE